MAFLAAADTMNALIRGENGSAAHATTQDPRVDLFFALVRNIPDARLKQLVSACFADSRTSPSFMAADLIVMAFQTRDCRGGKGERDLFHSLFLEIAERFPETAVKLVPLIPHYGYWKDVFVLINKAEKSKAGGALADAVITLSATQLKADYDALSAAAASGEKPEAISLLAKWAPREGAKAHKATAARLAAALFPGSSTSKAQYRRMLSDLNHHLGTVEVKMCEHAWSEIEATSVPSLTLMRSRKGFLNEKLKGPAPTGAEDLTGNRHPHDTDRVECRKHIRAALLEAGTKKLKGKQLFPHEIVEKCFHAGGGFRGAKVPSALELDIFNAQWAAIRDATREAMAKQQADATVAAAAAPAAAAASGGGGGAPAGGAGVGASVNLGKLVSLVDVSGSMSGIPMQVAIALGILVSELAEPAFAHRCITFHENPTWCRFEPGSSIAEKVGVAKRAPWGGSTNFEKAMDLILDVATEARLTPDQIPDLIVFSDMQFDSARGRGSSWETHHARIVRRFQECGKKVCGEPWPTPKITYWNLRGNTVGFPSQANTPGVEMLSGFSPALLKLLLSGEPLQGPEEEVTEEVEVMEGGVKVKKVVTTTKKNPLETLRRALDDPKYDAVREALAASKEGALADYEFIPPEAPSDQPQKMAKK